MSPLKPTDKKNSKLLKNKQELQLEILEKSLKSNISELQSGGHRKLSVTVEEVKIRQKKGRQGYLNKRSKNKDWKRRYFALRKPYLYYYNRKEDLINGIKENGAIDLAKSVISINKPDPNVFFYFFFSLFFFHFFFFLKKIISEIFFMKK